MQQSPKNLLLLSHYVSHIRQDEHGVTTTCIETFPESEKVRSKQFRSKYIVVTVPPPIAGRILYEPPLPPSKDFIFHAMRMGKMDNEK